MNIGQDGYGLDNLCTAGPPHHLHDDGQAGISGAEIILTMPRGRHTPKQLVDRLRCPRALTSLPSPVRAAWWESPRPRRGPRLLSD